MMSTPAIAMIVAGVFGMSPALAPASANASTAALSRPAAVSVLSPSVSTSLNPGSNLAANIVPRPFIGPDPVGGGSSLDTIARLDGVALLDQLARLSSAERSDFRRLHADALAGLTVSPPSAASVTTWWSRATTAQRSALTREVAGIVGNLEGVPYSVRDLANRAYLSETITSIRAQLAAGVGRAMENELQTRLKTLSAVEQSLRRGPSGESRSLVSLDVADQGRAVIAVGDLVAADYVTFFVPGMYVGVAEQLVDWTGNAETSLMEQREWLERLGLEGEVATVAWIGYHTPTVVNISSLDLAYQGRDALTWSLQGLEALRDRADASGQGTNPYVSIVAHSYGSTAAMLALQDSRVSVDALILVGSPGSPASNVRDLKVAGGNVWVAAADTDPVPRSGVFGSQPLDASFGASRFSVHAMTDPITGEHLTDISGHVYYFWPGTTSVRNTALIAIGHGDLASTDASIARAATK